MGSSTNNRSISQPCLWCRNWISHLMLRIFGSHNSGFCLYSGESVWLNKKVKEINTFLDFMKIGLVVFFFSDNCCRKLSNSSIKVCSLSVEYRYGMIIHDSEEIVRLAKYYVVFDLKSYFRNMTDIETGRCKQSSLKSIYIYIYEELNSRTQKQLSI